MTRSRAKNFSEADGAELSQRVREELARRRMTRQALADAARISISTLEKVLAGRRAYTLGTIVRLEEGLGAKLLERSNGATSHFGNGAQPNGAAAAPDELGNYNRAAVTWLEGTYLTIRPSFGERGALYAYRTDVSWSEDTATLVFREAERTDKDYAQFGSVAVPHQSGHIYFVTNRHGQHRMIVLARPTITGEMHGLLTTLQSGRGAQLTPVATPIVMKSLKKEPKAHYGRIARGHSAYPSYSALLRKTLDDNFAMFLPA